MRWLTSDEPRAVVDLGAGTGKLTRVLVALGHRVTAVEPLAEMLAVLEVVLPEASAQWRGARNRYRSRMGPRTS